MIILSLVKLNKGRTKICLDNGTDLVLYRGECSRFKVEEGAEITDSEYETIVREILIPRCKRRGLHLLEKQDRSEKNLRDKLKEGGYPEEVIDITIEWIRDYGYIDDERMARSYIRFYQDTRSRGRIKQDLMNKGINPDTIAFCLEDEYESDESELIEALLVKKNYNKEEATYEERAKIFRFLVGRGFSVDSINKALKSY